MLDKPAVQQLASNLKLVNASFDDQEFINSCLTGIENLSLKEVPARLAAYILTLSEEQKNSTEVTLPISKAQLSNLIGTTPETVSRIFKKMMASSFIEVKGKVIKIDDFQGLELLSESGSLS